MFVFILLFYSFGYFIVFKSVQYSIRKEIKQIARQKIDVNSLECFEFSLEYLHNPDKDFKWIESKEFRYKGKMYDILKTEKTQNTIKLYCINDEKEEVLVDNFLKFSNDFSGTNIPQNQSRQIALKFLQLIGVLNSSDSQTIFTTEISDDTYFEHKYKNVILEKLSPPPKSFSYTL